MLRASVNSDYLQQIPQHAKSSCDELRKIRTNWTMRYSRLQRQIVPLPSYVGNYFRRVALS